MVRLYPDNNVGSKNYQDDNKPHLKLLLLWVKLSATGDAPQHIEHQNLVMMMMILLIERRMFEINENDFHIYLVAESQWLALLLRKLPLQIIHLEITIRNTEITKPQKM